MLACSARRRGATSRPTRRPRRSPRAGASASGSTSCCRCSCTRCCSAAPTVRRPSGWPGATRLTHARRAPACGAPAGAAGAVVPFARTGRRSRRACARRRSRADGRLYLLARVVVARHYRQPLTLGTVAGAVCELAAPAAARVCAVRRDELPARTCWHGACRSRRSCCAEQPAIPVRDVARLVGYRQAPYFARVFRRRYGLPPARFRAQARAHRAHQAKLLRAARSRGRPVRGDASAPQRRRISVPPPGAGSALIAPPCCAATCRTIARPSPEPGVRGPRRRGRSGRRRAAGPRRRCRARGRGPSARSPCSADLDGPFGRAVLDGVVDQVVDGALQPRRHARHDRGPSASSKGDRGERACAPLDDLVRRACRGACPRRRRPAASPRASSIRSFISSVSSTICATTSIEQPPVLGCVHLRAELLQHLDVRAQARDGRAELVRGVGDELALGVHRGVQRVHRALERVEHRVEAAASRPISSSPRGAIRPLRVLCAASRARSSA